MNLKNVAKVGSLILLILALLQVGVIYLMNKEEILQQTLVAQQFEKAVAHQTRVLQDAINLSNNCNEQSAQKMQLSYPVHVSDIGLNHFAKYTHESTLCLQSLILAAGKKDPAFYQNTIAVLILQELRVATLTSAAIQDEQLNKKNKLLLGELLAYIKIAQTNTETFWQQYYAHQESSVQNFGVLGLSPINKIKNNKASQAQRNEKTLKVINNLKNEILNPELALKKESEKMN